MLVILQFRYIALLNYNIRGLSCEKSLESVSFAVCRGGINQHGKGSSGTSL